MWVCRLPVHIGPAGRTRFYGTLRRIRICQMGRQSRRPLRKGFNRFPYLVGADDSVRPQNMPVLWKSAANSYCHANFERRAFLPQLFKRSYPQIRCTVTGGAQSSARKVTWCVRNSYKSGLT